jgi:hypothetical protein
LEGNKFNLIKIEKEKQKRSVQTEKLKYWRGFDIK